MKPTDVLRAVLAAALIALFAACATVPHVQQAFAAAATAWRLAVRCPAPVERSPRLRAPTPGRCAGPELRVLSWNLHKNDDPGWDADLARFAAASDLLLIQEAALTAELLRVLQDAGYDWLLASSFVLNDHETGVLNAARVRPASACVQRFFEPLLQLPKSAVITRYEVKGTSQLLAVANVHSINFTLGLGRLPRAARGDRPRTGRPPRAGDLRRRLQQLEPERLDVVDDVMRGMGLSPVLPSVDTRSRFLGQQVDHVFVRGLEVVHAAAPEVESSDHNPVLATLRVAGAPR